MGDRWGTDVEQSGKEWSRSGAAVEPEWDRNGQDGTAVGLQWDYSGTTVASAARLLLLLLLGEERLLQLRRQVQNALRVSRISRRRIGSDRIGGCGAPVVGPGGAPVVGSIGLGRCAGSKRFALQGVALLRQHIHTNAYDLFVRQQKHINYYKTYSWQCY